MKDEFKNQLDAIFSNHEEKENKKIELKDRKAQQEDAFLKKFLDVSDSVVKPAFEEVGFLAKGKGLNYRIDKQADVTAYDGKHVRACILICFYFGDNSYRQFHEFPNLSIACDKKTSNCISASEHYFPRAQRKDWAGWRISIRDADD